MTLELRDSPRDNRRILMGYKEKTGAQLKGNNKPGLVIHQQGEEL